MPELFDHVGYLSQEIGPRPAGTEEEQQAAGYIADQLQNEAGLDVRVEDFSFSSGGEKHWLICAGVTVVAAILSLLLSFMAVPALILTVLSAAIVFLEYLGKPILSSRGKQGVSQNVVARYVPSSAKDNPAKRKIIVVTHYDSTKATAETGGFFGKNLPLLKKLWLAGMAAVAVLVLVKTIFFLHKTGAIAIVFAVLIIIAVILAALPLIFALLNKFAPFSPAANTSASGPAMLVELAARVNQAGGRQTGDAVPEAAGLSGFGPFDSVGSYDDPEIHGAAAAFAAGVVPAGAELEYDDGTGVGYPEQDYGSFEGTEPAGGYQEAPAGFDPLAPDGVPFDQGADSEDPVERLLAAKRAIAALTGRPLDISVDPEVAEAMRRAANIEAPVEAAFDAAAQLGEDALSGFQPGEVETVLGSLDFAQEPGGFQAAPVAGIAAAFVGAAMDVPEEFQIQADLAAEDVAVAGADAALEVAEAVAAVEEEPEVPGFDDVPDWFRKARANARKQEDQGEVQRSRFASTLDKTEAAFAAVAAEEEAAQNQAAEEELGERLRQMQADIMDVQAPKLDMDRIESIFDEEEEMPEISEFEAVAIAAAEAAGEEAPEAIAEDASEFSTADIPDLAAIIEQAVEAEPMQAAEVEPAQAEIEPPLAIPALQEEIPAAEDEGEEVSSTPLVAQRPKSEKFDDREVAPERAALRATLPSFSGIIANTSAMRALLDESEPQEDPLDAMRLPELNLGTNIINDQRVDFTADAVSGSAGMTGAFAPVGDELLAEAAQSAEAEDDFEDMYVDDADDSVFEGNFTETGAFAGPGYMDMPKSRKRLFGRHKKRDADLDISPQQWLNVEDGFDARTVGAERGGWESFRAEEDEIEQPTTAFNMQEQLMADQGYYEEDFQEGEEFAEEYADGFDSEPTGGFAAVTDDGYAEEYEDGFEEEPVGGFVETPNTDFGGNDFYSFRQGRWNGGAFSLRGFGKKDVIASGDLESYDDAYAGEIVEDYDGGYDDFDDQGGFPRSGETLRFDGEEAQDDGFFGEYDEGQGYEDGFEEGYEDGFEDEAYPAVSDDGADVREGLNLIGQFRGASVDTEVWFVALGAQNAGNAGVKAFFAEHQAELRGATIVELDAVAAGDLCIIQNEGARKPSVVSNRLSRIARSVADGMGLPLGEADLLWTDGAASFAQRNGNQAIHLVGMQNGMPALYNAKFDDMESLEPEIFAENIEYLTRLLEEL